MVYAVVASLAIGAAAGVGVIAFANVSFSTVEAGIGANNIVVAANVDVEALADRNVLGVTANAAGGTAGVAVMVTVVVVGNKMTQDAHDGLYEGMDPEAQVQGGFATDDSNQSQSARNNALKNKKRQNGELTALLAGQRACICDR